LSSGFNYNAFLASFDQAGSYRAAKRFGHATDQSSGAGVALGSQDDPVVVGSFGTSIDLGAGALVSAGGVDAFAGRFGSQGALQWGKAFGAAGLQQATAVARSTSDDSVMVTGTTANDFKLGACSPLATKGGLDVWLAWLTTSGECERSVVFGDAADQRPWAIATNPVFGTLVAVAGELSGSIEVGGVRIEAASGVDGFVTLFQQDNSAFALRGIWARRAGGLGDERVDAVTFDYQDNLILAGTYQGSDMDFGLPDTDAQSDAFVVKLTPGGELVWALRLGGPGVQSAAAVGADQLGNLYVAGSFEGQLALDNGQTLTSAGGRDIFVIKLAP
jgi:hypothetical protein